MLTACRFFCGFSRALLTAILVLIAWPLLIPTPAYAVSIQSQAGSTLQRLSLLTNDKIDFAVSPTFGTLTYLEASEGSLPLNLRSQSTSPEIIASTFLTNYGSLFGIANPSEELRVTRVQGDNEDFALGTLKLKSFTPTNPLGGNIHVRMQQQYNGLRVYGGELITHLSSDGRVKSINGHTIPNPTLDSTVPAIEKLEAQETGLAHFKQIGGTDDAVITDAQLVVIDPSLFTEQAPQTHLAWMFEIKNSGEITTEHKRYFVDAKNADVVFVQELIEDALNRQIYDCQGGGCKLVRSEGQKESGSEEADNIYTFAGDTYNYYKQSFNRDGLDGKGTRILAYANSNQLRCPNAAYGNATVNFCPGFGKKDVVAHELTHWVTSSTSQLVYQGQSGALNESFSDIMASMVDNNWKVGEDVPLARSRPGGVLRDMSDPTVAGDPDRVCSPKYYTGAGDNGGVHKNSGIPNKAAYLITDGGTFNGYTIKGIGREKSAKLHYQSLTTRYTQASDFCTHYRAIYEVCKGLYDQTTCEEVKKALEATEMHLTRAECTGDKSHPACLARGGPLPTSGPRPTSIPGTTSAPQPTSPPNVPTAPPPAPKVKGDVAIWVVDSTGTELPEGSALPKGDKIKICYNRKGGTNKLTINTGDATLEKVHDYPPNDVKKNGCVYTVPGNEEYLELGEKATAVGTPHVYSLDSGGTHVSTTLFVTTGTRRVPGPTEQPTQTPQATSIPGQPTPLPPTQSPAQPTPQPGGSRQSEVQKVIDQISENNIRSYMSGLTTKSDGQDQTRWTGSGGNSEEAQNIKSHFESLGISQGLKPFSPVQSDSFCKNISSSNIVGKITGKQSNTVYLMTAHMDSRAKAQPHNPAPGADDNGSGTVAVMEIARAIAAAKPDLNASIEFILFSGEEQGLCGSKAYVRNYVASEKNSKTIKGVFNLDMVAYNSGNSCVKFGYKPRNGGNIMSDRIVQIDKDYGIGLRAQSVESSIDRSDHAPFWAENIPAIFGFECEIFSNPHYHDVSDTMGYLKFDQLTKTAKAVAGAVVSLAKE